MANGNGKEGTYGFGRHFRQPMFRGPYRDPLGSFRVFNVAHQQHVQATDADSGPGLWGWTFLSLFVLVPTILLLGRRRPV